MFHHIERQLRTEGTQGERTLRQEVVVVVVLVRFLHDTTSCLLACLPFSLTPENVSKRKSCDFLSLTRTQSQERVDASLYYYGFAFL